MADPLAHPAPAPAPGGSAKNLWPWAFISLCALAALSVGGWSRVLAAPASPSANLAEAARQRAMDRDESRAMAQSLADEIARLRQQLIALGAEETNGERALTAKGARLAALNAAETDLADRMGRNQVRLSRLLGALQLYRKDPPPALLVSPKNAVDAVNAAILIKAIAPDLEAKARAFAAEAKTLQALRRSIVLANSDVLDAESQGAEQRAEIERLIIQKSALERRMDASADVAARDVRRLARQAKSLGQIITGLEAFEGSGVEGDDLRLAAPVSGAPIRRFKDRWPGQARSEGWSWRTNTGQVVLSPSEGRVDYVGPLKGWGLVLILRLAGAYHLVLAGLGASNVAIGSEVSAGEPIGRMAGRAGVKDKGTAPPELYLEVRKGDAPVDPARWLQRVMARGDH